MKEPAYLIRRYIFKHIMCTGIMRFLLGSDAKNVCCNLQRQKMQACDLPVNSWQVELYVKVLCRAWKLTSREPMPATRRTRQPSLIPSGCHVQGQRPGLGSECVVQSTEKCGMWETRHSFQICGTCSGAICVIL